MEREKTISTKGRLAAIGLGSIIGTAIGITATSAIDKGFFMSSNAEDYKIKVTTADEICYTNSYPEAPIEEDIIILKDAYCPTGIGEKTMIREFTIADNLVKEVKPNN